MTPKRLAFCREWVTDHNGTQAAIRAGYSAKTANVQAAQILAQPEVQAEIARLQAGIASAHNITVDSLLREAEEARLNALRSNSASAAVSATTLKAKLCGLLVERHEDLADRERVEAEKAQRGEIKKAASILAEVAQSVGLPADAEPAQIIGAISERSIVTPAAFRLIREMKLIEHERTERIT